MSAQTLILIAKSALALIGAVIITAFTAYRIRLEKKTVLRHKNKKRYRSVLPAVVLPLFFLISFTGILLFYGIDTALDVVLQLCLDLFICIAVYYVILVLLIEKFRKRINSGICSILWFLPLILYVVYRYLIGGGIPLLKVTISYSVAWILLFIWLAGFIVTLAIHLVSHIRFRKLLLATQGYVNDREVNALWRQAQDEANFHLGPFALRTSTAISTPLSIGFRKSSTQVFLPKKNYTHQQLQLIFRHELVHISRNDSLQKFALVFCTAVCWFNPLMWYGVKQSAIDLEASCDEAVLRDSDDAERRLYADLLLRTADDEKGFSTCLSASAEALRNRIHAAIHPINNFGSILLITLFSFLILFIFGCIGIEYSGISAQQVFFRDHDPTTYKADQIYYTVNGVEQEDTVVSDQQALNQYLASLQLKKVNSLIFMDDEPFHQASFFCFSPHERIMHVRIVDQYVSVVRINGIGITVNSQYRIQEPFDWEWFSGILRPEEPHVEYPFPPKLNVTFDNASIHEGSGPLFIAATVYNMSSTKYSTPPEPSADKSCGVYGIEVTKAQLVFSQPPDGAVRVYVENWDRSKGFWLESSRIGEDFVLLLEDYSAHYTVHATFSSGHTTCDAKFEFSVELP